MYTTVYEEKRSDAKGFKFKIMLNSATNQYGVWHKHRSIRTWSGAIYRPTLEAAKKHIVAEHARNAA